MNIASLISYDLPILSLSDTCERAIRLMQEFRVFHLPLVQRDNYIALISEDDFLQAEHLCRRAMKAANGLIRFLESTPDPAPAPYKQRPAP